MRIVYENLDKTIAVIIPSADAEEKYGLEAIAKKDTPAGLPYWIVEDSEIPTDRTFRDAWIVDPNWGARHGVGAESNSFEEAAQ